MSVTQGGRRSLPGAAVIKRQLSVGIGIVLARACGFVTGAIVARRLGPHGFGQYTLAFTVFGSLLQLSSFADTWLVSRWGPHEHAQGVMGAVWRLKRDALLLLLTGAVLMGAVVAASGQVETATLAAVLLGVVAAGLGGYTTALAAVGQAERRFRLYSIAVAGPPALILTTTAIVATTRSADPIAFVVAMLLSYVPFAWYAARLIRARAAVPPLDLRRDLLSFGGWVTVGTVFYAVFQRIDVFFLGTFRTVSDVGQYGAAVRLSAVGALGASIVGAALMPSGSRGETWTDPVARRRYLEEAGLAAVGIASAVGGVILIAPWLIVRVFGGEYSSAINAARILLLGQLVLGVQQPYYFALYGLDGRRWIAGISLAQLALAIAAGAWLSKTFGLEGAAWSNTLTYIAGAIGVTVFLLPRLRKADSPA